MSSNGPADDGRVDLRDYYEVLGAEPSATVAELRAAFREAVLRHHPDRSSEDSLATRRTSVLNRAWSELRDPVRRMHYDHALERGGAATLAWPLGTDEAASPAAPAAPCRSPSCAHRGIRPSSAASTAFACRPRSSWPAQPRSEHGSWPTTSMARTGASTGSATGSDSPPTHYRDRGRTDDWLGALERLVELDGTYETLVRADLRAAYVAAQEYLRGTGFLRTVAMQYASGSPQRKWVDRELRALLAEYRDARVRKGRPEDRAEAAELLLNYLEALEMPPAFADVRAAIMAHVRAGHAGRAAELLERAVAVPITEPARWFSMVQLLTEGGQLDRASAMLAGIARGDHPEALNRRRLRGDPARRIAAARVRLERARQRVSSASAR